MIRQSGASVIIGVLFYSIDFEKNKKINKQDASFGFFFGNTQTRTWNFEQSTHKQKYQRNTRLYQISMETLVF